MKFLLIPISLFAVWVAWGLYINLSTERVGYEVDRKLGEVEIRDYPNTIVARVASMDDNSGFRKLFNYISGSNEDKQKIAMTAPVINDETGMSFVMPSSLDDVPDPTNEDIEIIRIPPRKVAAIKFSGYTTEAKQSNMTDRLLKTLQENNIEWKGEPFLMRYNDPWTPPFMRRNEIGVEI